MRSSQRLQLAATRCLQLAYGPTAFAPEHHPDDSMQALSFPPNERGVKASFVFPEENTAVYEAYMPWTYLQPGKVDIERLPAPDPKYYQVHTKRLWDISSTEQMEIIIRKRFYGTLVCGVTLIFLYGFLKDERSYDGTEGHDPFWALLPKNRPEWF